MKFLKMLILGLLAMSAMMVLVGTGSASATVLCLTTTTTCGARYVEPTPVEGTLIGATKLEASGVLNECTESTLKGNISKGGSATETLAIEITSLTWGGCTAAPVMIANGTLEIHAINATDNGTVTAIGTETTVMLFGVSCTYGTGVGIDLGTFVGGTTPIMTISTKVKKTAGGMLCPVEPTWTAEYRIPKPTNPLYIEPS